MADWSNFAQQNPGIKCCFRRKLQRARELGCGSSRRFPSYHALLYVLFMAEDRKRGVELNKLAGTIEAVTRTLYAEDIAAALKPLRIYTWPLTLPIPILSLRPWEAKQVIWSRWANMTPITPGITVDDGVVPLGGVSLMTINLFWLASRRSAGTNPLRSFFLGMNSQISFSFLFSVISYCSYFCFIF